MRRLSQSFGKLVSLQNDDIYLYTWMIRASVEAAVMTCAPSISTVCLLHMLWLGVTGNTSSVPSRLVTVIIKLVLPVEP